MENQEDALASAEPMDNNESSNHSGWGGWNEKNERNSREAMDSKESEAANDPVQTVQVLLEHSQLVSRHRNETRCISYNLHDALILELSSQAGIDLANLDSQGLSSLQQLASHLSSSKSQEQVKFNKV